MANSAGVIGHFDVEGDDIDALVNFYGSLFGWDIVPRGPGYAQIETPGLNGAIVEAPDPAFTLGVIVPNLDIAMAQAEGLGGKVTMEATDNGWVRKGRVSDPAGNLLTLIQK